MKGSDEIRWPDRCKEPIYSTACARRKLSTEQECMSLTQPANREAFKIDEEVYSRKYGLSDETIALGRNRDWIGMIRSGGNIYYVFKLAAIDHVSMQHVGAQQNSMTLEDRAKLNSHREE